MSIFLFFVFMIGQYQVQCIFIPNPADPLSMLAFVITSLDIIDEAPKAEIEDVLNAVSQVTDAVNEMGNKISNQIDAAVRTLIKRLPLFAKIDSRFQRFWGYVLRIDHLYKNMQTYLHNNKTMNDYTLKDFLKRLTSQNDDDLHMTTINLHAMIVPFGEDVSETLMGLIVTEAQENIKELCDTKESPQQRLLELYVTALLSEMKAYAATSFAYSMLSKKGHDFMGELCKYERELEIRIREYGSTVKDIMSDAPRTVRRCDPINHIRNKTFYEFERFQQLFIVQETALINSENDCHSRCGDAEGPRKLLFGCRGYHCVKNEKSCLGTASNCETITNDDHAGVETCELDPSEARRMSWFKDGYGKYYGNHIKDCSGEKESPDGYSKGWESFPPMMPGARPTSKHLGYCDTCLCLCTEDDVRSPSLHFISLREQSANIGDNNIVVGLKFMMQNKILHLQIQEGKLGENGTVDPETVEWKPLENIMYDQEASISENSFIFYKEDESGVRTPLKENVDVAVLTAGKKTIYLDRLETSEEMIITGVRFKRVASEEDERRPIQLEIRETRFNYETGELISPDNQSAWINADDMKKNAAKFRWYRNNRTEFRMSKDQTNPLVQGDTFQNSKPNSWLEITHSSKNNDAGQTVLPLIDGLAVTNTGPIEGVNFFHKTQTKPGSGGFLSLELVTIDRSIYITLPPENSGEEREECKEVSDEVDYGEDEDDNKKNKKNKKDKKKKKKKKNKKS